MQNKKLLKGTKIKIVKDLTRFWLNLFKAAEIQLNMENVWLVDVNVCIVFTRKPKRLGVEESSNLFALTFVSYDYEYFYCFFGLMELKLLVWKLPIIAKLFLLTLYKNKI